MPLSPQIAPASTDTDPARLHLEIRGRVQGLGFRPFVWNLAHELRLTGWVRNSSEGVQLEVEGAATLLRDFLGRLKGERPPHASLTEVAVTWLPRRGYPSFEILESGEGKKSAVVLPDLATCSQCLRELTDPQDRRFRYPFLNCTQCGPRFSILRALPYDRKNTSMASFSMCPACRSEYLDPGNRRFHAQPNACWDCGPKLRSLDAKGRATAAGESALREAAALIRRGKILSVKGLGGFHLMADARNEAAVRRLRRRKFRPHKPLALMFPTVEMVEAFTELSELERDLLGSPAAPIVLLRYRESPPFALASAVAPGNPYHGIMLPYTPLHHLLMRDLGFPVVTTSGNRSEEPICISGEEARQRLTGIADGFLDHDRPIVRPMDDSVVRVMAGSPTVLRRARGYAPFSLKVSGNSDVRLAVGAHLKNTVALRLNDQVVLSQHLGDLDTALTQRNFKRTIDDFENFYEAKVKKIICDCHPDYSSTQWAVKKGGDVIQIQHHHAHVVSCMAEHGLSGTVLGVAWDGTGYGLDKTIWGGEFLLSELRSFERTGHFLSFPLPGGEGAIREPRRSALGLLFEVLGERLFSMEELLLREDFTPAEWNLLREMLIKALRCPRTSSVGRLFDAVAALLGLGRKVSFEGQAAMALEFAAERSDHTGTYPLEIFSERSTALLDWRPMISAVLEDRQGERSVSEIARKFHNTLVEGILQVARLVGERRVVLTGGCFQNRLLTETAVRRLKAEGFEPFWHREIPPNDGGIALGQAVAAT